MNFGTAVEEAIADDKEDEVGFEEEMPKIVCILSSGNPHLPPMRYRR
jgi:hypothetical protein